MKRLGGRVMKKADKQNGKIYSSKYKERIGPGIRYEVFAVETEILIKSQIDNTILGKAIYYEIQDSFSECIMGLGYGLSRPSWDGVISAIYNCIEDKVEFCKKYGIDTGEDQWASPALPKKLLLDRGDFSGIIPEALISQFKIDIEFTRGQAIHKGKIEKRYLEINKRFKDFNINSIKERKLNRSSENNTQLDKTLTIDEFMKIMILNAIRHNNSIMTGYQMNKELIQDNIQPIPIELYKWRVKREGTNQAVPCENLMIKYLMHHGKASISENGLVFKTIKYDCDVKKIKKFNTNTDNLKSCQVDIRYDRRSTNQIYILNPDLNIFEALTIKEDKFKDKSFDEIQKYLIKRNFENYDLEIKNDD